LLIEAIAEIELQRQAAAARAAFGMRRRRLMRQADLLIAGIEELIADRQEPVPPSLMREVVQFVRPLSQKLLRRLLRAGPQPPQVLDVLFDTQALLNRHLTLAPKTRPPGQVVHSVHLDAQ